MILLKTGARESAGCGGYYFLVTMHPWLEDLTLLTMLVIFHSENKCITFFTDMGLLPRPDENILKCPQCFSVMSVRKDINGRCQWYWTCRKRTQKTEDTCNIRILPSMNTLFSNMKVTFQDMLILIYCFVIKLPVNTVVSEMIGTRLFFKERSISNGTIIDVFALLRHVCDIQASHLVSCLGGPGKKVKLSDTFTTRTKHPDRQLHSPDLFVLGIYCEEDNEGVIVEVDENEEIDLLSLIHVYCHPETTIIPLNSVETSGVMSTEIKSKHLIENEYRKLFDAELQDHLRKSFSTKLIFTRRDMSQTLYWRIRFPNKSVPEKMEIFLQDIRSVYPGIFAKGLRLRSVKKLAIDSSND